MGTFEYVPSPDLVAHAEKSIDMVPHLYHLAELASHAQSIVEFGIRSGVSTWALLDGLPADGTYFGVDIDPAVRHFTPARIWDDPRVTIVIGDDREVELPEHADLVMIDSSHQYEHTIQELDIAVRLTPATIAMHDYLYLEDRNCHVRPAVDEWLKTGSYRFATLHPSKWGLLVLVPK